MLSPRNLLWLFALALFLIAPRASGQGVLDEVWPLVQQGKMDQALAKTKAFLVDHPDDPAGHHAFGRIKFMQGEHAASIGPLERCIELGPTQAWMTAWSHNVLGQAYAALDKRDLALEHLRKAIELNATGNCTKDARRALAALTGENPFGKGPLVGKPLPDFEFQGVAGETYRPGDFDGRPLFLKFGPSW